MNSRSERFTTESLRGVHLHARHWGDPVAPSLILLHGGGANAAWWEHLAPALAGRFHVVALDFRGHGQSDYPDDMVVGAFNDDLDALLEHLQLSDACLVGHSMGGHVAIEHTARDASVRKLVLLDVMRGAARRPRRATRLALKLRRSYATREEAVRRYRFFPEARFASEALRASIAAGSLCEEPDGRFGYAFDPRWFSVPSRPRPELSLIGCPTMLVRGSESELLTHEGALAITSELRDPTLREIQDAGHHVQIDQPERVLDVLMDFLAGSSAKPTPG